MSRHIDRRLDNLAQRLDQAARIKPNLDTHLATQLAYADTKASNETGISGNTISDPTISRIMARAHVIDRSNMVERRVCDIEAAINALDEAMRTAWGRDRPIVREEAPICYMSGCSREVGSYRRADESIAFRASGLCDMHEIEQMRADESNARRQRRYRAS